ncbi:hypothetical protein V6N13_123936 [Hibiscus sabdariffa]
MGKLDGGGRASWSGGRNARANGMRFLEGTLESLSRDQGCFEKLRSESLLRCSWWSKGLGVGVKACLKAARDPGPRYRSDSTGRERVRSRGKREEPGLTDIDKRSIANQSHSDVKLANMPLSRRD